MAPISTATANTDEPARLWQSASQIVQLDCAARASLWAVKPGAEADAPQHATGSKNEDASQHGWLETGRGRRLVSDDAPDAFARSVTPSYNDIPGRVGTAVQFEVALSKEAFHKQ